MKGSSVEGEDIDSLVYSPTWAVAAVCAMFVLCSLVVERAIYFAGHVLRSCNQTALSAALEKIKEELMVVGFTSLALAVGQRSVVNLCVSTELVDFMPQCTRPLVYDERSYRQPHCPKGKSPFIRMESLHELHILLFVLAIVHMIYSIAIMALGMWKVQKWAGWEERAHTRLHGQRRLTREATFIRRHVSGLLSTNWFFAYVAAFFQQFYRSVSETDYLTLRHGFMKKHMLRGFNFHQYILNTLEDDFRHVVGISPFLWGYMVLLTFLNVQGWEVGFWASFIPLIMVLALGAKLRHIIIQMAIQYCENNTIVEGLPEVKPTDELFWFGNPRLILYFIHYILFQDALELSLHLWGTFVYARDSCFYRHHYLRIGRLVLGVLTQLICGYVMLPIYALVSQMGSEMKGSSKHMQTTSLNLHEEIQKFSGQFHSKEPERMLAVQEPGIMSVQMASAGLHEEVEQNYSEEIDFKEPESTFGVWELGTTEPQRNSRSDLQCLGVDYVEKQVEEESSTEYYDVEGGMEMQDGGDGSAEYHDEQRAASSIRRIAFLATRITVV